MYQSLSPVSWKEYELIDSGNLYKLEKFGPYILSRPEPQAVWKKSLPDEEWEKRAHAHFERDKNNPEKGLWKLKKGMEEQWKIRYNYQKLSLTFRLGLTSFKHIGLFPEQSENWNYIYDKATQIKNGNIPKVLNLFAYTGGASLAAKAAGTDVVHVDSVKQVITWSGENMRLSGLDNIRWVVEDALKFVKREVKRGAIYQGIILDPPAYGRGPDGEKWILEDQIDEIIGLCSKILDVDRNFFILNLYSMGFSPLIAETILKTHFKKTEPPEYGELFVEDNFNKKLPLGIYARFSNIKG